MADIMSAQNVDVINKGSIAEIFTGLEIIKNSPADKKTNLYYWHREKRGSNAEVDYLIQCGEQIIPIEVKSGIRGKMHSLRLFIAEHNTKKGIRISQENFHNFDNIHVYPLYAVKNIFK